MAEDNSKAVAHTSVRRRSERIRILRTIAMGASPSECQLNSVEVIPNAPDEGTQGHTISVCGLYAFRPLPKRSTDLVQHRRGHIQGTFLAEKCSEYAFSFLNMSLYIYDSI